MSRGASPYMTILSGSRKELAWGLKNESAGDIKAEMSVLQSLLTGALKIFAFCITFPWLHVHINHFHITWVQFLSWQDIIPVITGNKRLWHSHKIDAQWQNLCSKASTASFAKCLPPPPPQSKRSNFDNHDYKNNNEDELCHSCD